ncbi:hypothetical protein WA577_002729, partial [Blastocystis sp. JDR]
MDSLKELLLRSLTKQAESIAVVDYVQQEDVIEYTYADLLKQQRENEDMLSAFQIDSSHIMILLLPNSFAFVSWVVTCIANDICFLSVDDDPFCTEDILSASLKQLPVSLLVTTDSLYSKYITKDLPLNLLLIDSTAHFVYSFAHP